MITDILAISLVVSNIAWLYFTYKLLSTQQRERWELRERERAPEDHINPPELTDYERDQIEQINNLAREHITETEDEFDAVGAINPQLPLRPEDTDNG